MSEQSAHSVPQLFYIFALISMFYMAYNLRRLFTVQVGKPDNRSLNLLSQLYNSLSFGIGQKKVYSKRFTYASIMHFLIGWGFIELTFATTVDFFAAQGIFKEYLPGFDTPWFAWLNDTGGMMLIVGCMMALFRRHYIKPDILPQNNLSGRGTFLGDSGILFFLVFLSIGGFFTEAARLAVEQPPTAHWSWVGYLLSKLTTQANWVALKPYMWWGHAITSLIFISLIPMTKMFHVIAVVANVALTNRKKRGLLKSMNISEIMENPNADVENISLGASNVKDFSWKQLLDSVSCTECARCSSVCPATRTDKPLSPMKIITDIRTKLYSETMDYKKTDDLVGGLITETELWSCTTCGACMQECPVLIEHVPTIIDMRRHLVLSEGKPPVQANESLEKTMLNGNPWGFPKEDRLKWTESTDFKPPTLQEKNEVDILYWVGCAGAYDPRNQSVATNMLKILESADVDYAVLGKEETCTGDSARRLGEEYLFETLAKQNVETLNKYKFNKIVASCPHCMNTILNEYPDFGGEYKVVHHTELIEELISTGQLQTNYKTDKKITFHDPCYLGRHNKIFDQPRNILENVAEIENIIEMKESRESSMCCGAGGGNMWHEIDQGSRVNVERFEQAVETGADTVATGCSFCTIMMDDAMKVTGKEETMQVKDIAEIVGESIDHSV
ncbi:MAG: hypothetical protein CMG24_04315 [Candidatus Marinimicrobia bacterium]|nr:hypothetical protein [Candidatus Neomarinimicrobiota bacterium]